MISTLLKIFRLFSLDVNCKVKNVRTVEKLEGHIVRGNAGPKLDNWNMRGNGLSHL
jgi:hypothetical protein